VTTDDRDLTPEGDADVWVTRLLADLDRPPMPDDVWLRLEAHFVDLGQEARAATARPVEVGPVEGRAGQRAVHGQGAPERDVRGRRLRGRRLGAALGGLAAACAAVLVGGLAVQSAVTSSPAPPLAPPPLSSALTSTSALAVLQTRTAYATESLPGQVTAVMAQTGLGSRDDVQRAVRRSESLRLPTLATTGFTAAHTSIAACVGALADALGLTTPALLVDRGTVDGRERGLVVFESATDGELTIAIVDPACEMSTSPATTVRALLP
jgi:hypothetical protein